MQSSRGCCRCPALLLWPAAVGRARCTCLGWWGLGMSGGAEGTSGSVVRYEEGKVGSGVLSLVEGVWCTARLPAWLTAGPVHSLVISLAVLRCCMCCQSFHLPPLGQSSYCCWAPLLAAACLQTGRPPFLKKTLVPGLSVSDLPPRPISKTKKHAASKHRRGGWTAGWPAFNTWRRATFRPTSALEGQEGVSFSQSALQGAPRQGI